MPGSGHVSETWQKKRSGVTGVRYIQIGVTALRDPMTGKPLEAVPMYIQEKDAARLPEAKLRADDLAKKIGEYIRETRKAAS